MKHVALIPVGDLFYKLIETPEPPTDEFGNEANYSINHDRREILLWASAHDKTLYAACATSDCWRETVLSCPTIRSFPWQDESQFLQGEPST